MFRIYDGRDYFYQWDLDRKLIVEDSSIKEVHFCNRTDGCSLICETYDEDGARLVNVPNILLHDDWEIRVYAYDVNYTKYEERFEVKARTKPADYIYTEVELESWDKLEERMEHVEDVVFEQNFDKAVNDYFIEHPELRGPQGEAGLKGEDGESGVYVGETMPGDDEVLVWINPEGEPTTDLATQRYVQQEIAKVTGVDLSDYYTKEEVDEAIANIEVSGGDVDLSNYYTKEEVDGAIESIELTPGPQGEQGPQGEPGKDGQDGAPGKDGAQGAAGYTPVKGVDYFDGKDGAPGADGKDGKDGVDGKTPQKGIDYFTEQDKAELISSVVAALPVYNGEVVNG